MSTFRELLNKTLEEGHIIITGIKRDQNQNNSSNIPIPQSQDTHPSPSSPQSNKNNKNNKKKPNKKGNSPEDLIRKGLAKSLNFFYNSFKDVGKMRQEFRYELNKNSAYKKPTKDGDIGSISKAKLVIFFFNWHKQYKKREAFDYKKYPLKDRNYEQGFNLLMKDSNLKKLIQGLLQNSKKSKFPEKIQLK